MHTGTCDEVEIETIYEKSFWQVKKEYTVVVKKPRGGSLCLAVDEL
jgi:hypothetical protein